MYCYENSLSLAHNTLERILRQGSQSILYGMLVSLF